MGCGPAAEARQRAADLEEAWLDPDIHAVPCARGGYGSARLLEIVEWAKLADAIAGGSSKPFVGSSDITALHQAFALTLPLGSHAELDATSGVLRTRQPAPAAPGGRPSARQT